LIEQIDIRQLTGNLFECSLRGDHSTLADVLLVPTKSVDNIRYEAIQQQQLLLTRNDQTRTCLDVAAMLGHDETTKLLAERAATMATDAVNLTNGMGNASRSAAHIHDEHVRVCLGYSSVHLACVWNQLESVKQMIDAGGNAELTTIHGDTPMDIARRYGHEQLVAYLQWIGESVVRASCHRRTLTVVASRR
jgi:ankyrin repeat protein